MREPLKQESPTLAKRSRGSVKKPKSLFQSSIVFNSTIAGIAIAISSAIDPIGAFAKTFVDGDRLATARIDSFVQFVKISSAALGLGGTGGAIFSRLAKGDIYTPPWAPGANKEDLMAEISVENVRSDQSEEPDKLNPVFESTPNSSPNLLSQYPNKVSDPMEAISFERASRKE